MQVQQFGQNSSVLLEMITPPAHCKPQPPPFTPIGSQVVVVVSDVVVEEVVVVVVSDVVVEEVVEVVVVGVMQGASAVSQMSCPSKGGVSQEQSKPHPSNTRFQSLPVQA